MLLGKTTRPALLALVLLAGNARAEDITIRFQPSCDCLPQLPLLRALQAGYFQKEGLKLETAPLNPNSAQVAATVAAGSADIGTLGPVGTLSALGAGRDAVSIAILAKEPAAQLTLNQAAVDQLKAQGITIDSPIEQRVRGLKGMKIGTGPAAGTIHGLMTGSLSAYGVAPDDVTIVPLASYDNLALTTRAGQLDGYLAPVPQSALGAAEGWGHFWINYSQGDVPSLSHVPIAEIVTSRAFIQKNPEAVRRFLKAIWHASQDIQDNLGEVKSDVKEAYFKDLNEQVYDRAVDASIGAFGSIVPSNEGFQRLLESYNRTAEKKLEVTYDKVYANKFANETMPAGFKK